MKKNKRYNMNQEKKEKSVEELNKEIQDYIKSFAGKEITPELEKQINFAKSIFKISDILKAAKLEQEESAKLISQINSIVDNDINKKLVQRYSLPLEEAYKKVYNSMNEIDKLIDLYLPSKEKTNTDIQKASPDSQSILSKIKKFKEEKKDPSTNNSLKKPK